MSWNVIVMVGGIPLLAAMSLAMLLVLWRIRNPRTVALWGGVVFIAGLVAFSILLARTSKKIGAYSNPNEPAMRAAIARNPNDAAAHMSLSRIASMRGRKADRIRHLREVARIEPNNREALFLLALSLKRVRRSESLALFQKLAQENDDWGRAAQKAVSKMSRR